MAMDGPAEPRDDLGLGLVAGAKHYRAYVGPPEDYDLIAAMTFGLLTALGLRQHHRLLDIGCGSLRVGRLLIPYLNAGGYVGVEPNPWLVESGIEREVGRDLVRVKRPRLIQGSGPDALDAGDRFDFALAQSIFSHAGPRLIGRWLEGTAARLNPQGVLVATFLIGEGDYDGGDWTYANCVRYRVETMDAWARGAGLRFRLLPWRHPRQTWAAFGAPRWDDAWLERVPLGWNGGFEAGLWGREDSAVRAT